jgi:homopolymeric O-antigen transport system ATP-binding protein
MSNSIIKVEGLSKRYNISHKRVREEGLRHVVERFAKNPIKWLKAMKRQWNAEKEEFWALKDVSFEIKQGAVTGIIGRNGAGKSTLLKILSRITEPTSGRIHIKGRMASLLEVGTGFHQELTGRENIFLNGSILGMSKVEIKRKFDEIVAFSEVEKFLDTPVKRYSSGMYVRLAFAVAAHLEPEILIVDEVLAVGDAEFQKKCLGKMRDVATGGRTVLFVSHNMQAISVLCNSALYLDTGTIAYSGEVKAAIESYLQHASQPGHNQSPPSRRPGSGEYRFMLAQPILKCFASNEEKTIHFQVEQRKPLHAKMWLSAHIVDSNGAILIQCDSRLVGTLLEDKKRCTGRFRFTTPWLKPGTYRVDLFICAAGATGIVDAWEGACTLTISAMLPYEYSAAEDGTKVGVVFSDFDWETDQSVVNADPDCGVKK